MKVVPAKEEIIAYHLQFFPNFFEQPLFFLSNFEKLELCNGVIVERGAIRESNRTTHRSIAREESFRMTLNLGDGRKLFTLKLRKIVSVFRIK